MAISLRTLSVALVMLMWSASASRATEPLQKRDFAGRLCIIYNGAGETPEGANLALDSILEVKAFVADGPGSIPAVLFSSDPTAQNSKTVVQMEQSGSLLTLRSSKESLEKLLGTNGILEQLKSRLSAEPQFKKLVTKGEDVSRYLKIEIVIASHGTKDGLPIWNLDSDSGERHGFDAPFLARGDFQRLYQIFPDATVHAIIGSCYAAHIGETLAPDRALLPSTAHVNYSFVAAVDRDVLEPVMLLPRGSDPEQFADRSLLSEHFSRCATKGKWQGATSLFELDLSMFNHFRNYGVGKGSRGFARSMYSMSNDESKEKPQTARSNPYERIAVTSLDDELQSDIHSGSGRSSEHSNKANDTVGVRALSAEIQRLLYEQESVSNYYVLQQFRAQDNFVIVRQRTERFSATMFCGWKRRMFEGRFRH